MKTLGFIHTKLDNLYCYVAVDGNVKKVYAFIYPFAKDI